jgi:oligosaccharide repeat unit polymerase
MPFILRQLIRITTASAYIYLYIFINNLLAKKKSIKSNIILLFPIVLFIIDSLLFAARGYMLNLMIAGIVYWYIIYSNKKGNYKVNIKLIKKGLIILLIIVILFVFLRQFVGRSMSEKSKSDPVYYVSIYVGAPIQLLDLYLNEDDFDCSNEDAYFGKNTLNALYNYVKSKSSDNEALSSGDLEFRFSNGYNIGNVYTSIRTYYSDFGYFGTLICSMILSSFYTALYYLTKKSLFLNGHSFKLIIFAYMSSGFFYYSIAERFFSSFVTPGLIPTLLVFYLEYKILVKKGSEYL